MKPRFPGQISTSVSVLIGRSGSKRHRLRLTIRRDKRAGRANFDQLVALVGQTWCGSQRFGSGWHSLRLDAADVDCERCLAQTGMPDDAAATDLLETDRRGKLVVQQGVTIDGT